MDKTKILLLVMAAAGCLAVPFAYFAGQIHTEGTLRLEMESELSVIRIDHANSMAELRQEIGMLHMEQEKMSSAIRDDLKSAGIQISDWEPAPPETKPDPIPADSAIQTILNQLKPDMAYEDVLTIFEQEGKLAMDINDATGASLKIYQWTWTDSENTTQSISITFTFTNNKLKDISLSAPTPNAQ
ncbi:MAG: hypothetical protein COA73_10665 [Candidatus Hydrogenedentota bacterium]|nr:MAG: hypothetical protein COA73_10665 [Candidatus Hydrogenedentota bacterium]